MPLRYLTSDKIVLIIAMCVFLYTGVIVHHINKKKLQNINNIVTQIFACIIIILIATQNMLVAILLTFAIFVTYIVANNIELYCVDTVANNKLIYQDTYQETDKKICGYPDEDIDKYDELWANSSLLISDIPRHILPETDMYTINNKEIVLYHYV
jgi:hypothetical protein